MKTKEIKFNITELLNDAHDVLTNTYSKDLISFDSFNHISKLITEAQETYIDTFDYDKLNDILTIKKKKGGKK